MYTNIPQNELMQIIRNTLEHNNTPENQKELIPLAKSYLKAKLHATHAPTI
jgi:hypothetical protein